MLKRLAVLFVLGLLSFSSLATSVSSIKIAASSKGGVYYPAALQICSFITKYSPITRCDVVASSGSVNNLNLLSSGKVDFAFVQADMAKDAESANGVFSGQMPYKDIRQVLTLFPEVFSVLAKDERGIINFSDLSGARIGMNLKGSGAKGGLAILFNYFKFKNDPVIVNVQDERMADKLCSGEVDAVVLFTGYPSSFVSKIVQNCDVEFVSVDAFKLEAMLSENSVYQTYILPQKLYEEISRNATSFATDALLVTNSSQDQDRVRLIRSLVAKYFDEFTELHPALNHLDKTRVFKDGVIPSYPE